MKLFTLITNRTYHASLVCNTKEGANGGRSSRTNDIIGLNCAIKIERIFFQIGKNSTLRKLLFDMCTVVLDYS